MYIRTAAITALTASLTFGLLAGAPAASADSEGDQITEFPTQTVRATLSLDPKSRKASITDLSAITGLVDRAGKLIGSVTKAPLSLRASAGAGGISEGSCVNNRSAKRFYAYAPQRISIKDKLGGQNYVVSPYRKDKARKVGTTKRSVRSTQFELCTTGGADLQDGFRIYQAGIGMTLLSREGFKIDQRWQSGQTPADYGLSLGFKLGKKDVPLEVTGALTQAPRDFLKGSFFGPYQSFMDDYSQNSVNAWWEDGCLNGYSRCVARADGSPDFQGAVAHGLWEFLPGQLTGDLQYQVVPYLRYACKGIFGCG